MLTGWSLVCQQKRYPTMGFSVFRETHRAPQLAERSKFMLGADGECGTDLAQRVSRAFPSLALSLVVLTNAVTLKLVCPMLKH